MNEDKLNCSRCIHCWVCKIRIDIEKAVTQYYYIAIEYLDELAKYCKKWEDKKGE